MFLLDPLTCVPKLIALLYSTAQAPKGLRWIIDMSGIYQTVKPKKTYREQLNKVFDVINCKEYAFLQGLS